MQWATHGSTNDLRVEIQPKLCMVPAHAVFLDWHQAPTTIPRLAKRRLLSPCWQPRSSSTPESSASRPFLKKTSKTGERKEKDTERGREVKDWKKPLRHICPLFVEKEQSPYTTGLGIKEWAEGAYVNYIY